MCKAISEGGKRCDGQHLSLDDHRNRAERRRERDRKRKASRRGVPAVATLPEFPACGFPRPSDIPEGYLHKSQFTEVKSVVVDSWARGAGAGLRTTEDVGAGVSRLWLSPDEARALLDSTEYAEGVAQRQNTVQRLAREAAADEEATRRRAETPGDITVDQLLARGWSKHYITKLLGAPRGGSGGWSTPSYPLWKVMDAEASDDGLQKRIARDVETRRLKEEQRKADAAAREVAEHARRVARVQAVKEAEAAQWAASERRVDDWKAQMSDAPLDDDTLIPADTPTGTSYVPAAFTSAVKGLSAQERGNLERKAAHTWVSRCYSDAPTEARKYLEDRAITALGHGAVEPSVIYEMLHAPGEPHRHTATERRVREMRWLPSPAELRVATRYQYPLGGAARFAKGVGAQWYVIAPTTLAVQEENGRQWITVTKKDGTTKGQQVTEGIPVGEVGGEQAVLYATPRSI